MRVESKNRGFAVSSLIRERNPSGCHFWMSKPGSPVSVHYYRALKPCTGFQLVPFTIFRNDCVAVTLHSESPPSDRQQEPSCSLPSNTLLLRYPQHLVAISSHHPPAGNEWTERKGHSVKSLRRLHVTRSSSWLVPCHTGAHTTSLPQRFRPKQPFPPSLPHPQEATLWIDTRGSVTILPHYYILISHSSVLKRKSFLFNISFWWKMNTPFGGTSSVQPPADSWPHLSFRPAFPSPKDNYSYTATLQC